MIRLCSVIKTICTPWRICHSWLSLDYHPGLLMKFGDEIFGRSVDRFLTENDMLDGFTLQYFLRDYETEKGRKLNIDWIGDSV